MIEVEIKLPVESAEVLMEQLKELFFVQSAKIREQDIYYDNDACFIRSSHQALRIRSEEDLLTGKTMSCITFKGKKMDTMTATRPEYETEVSDRDNAARILEEIGYHPVEPAVIKVRTMLKKDQMTACVDCVEGLGDFLELEVLVEDERNKPEAVADIEAVLSQLGYTLEDTVQTSYLGLLMKKM